MHASTVFIGVLAMLSATMSVAAAPFGFPKGGKEPNVLESSAGSNAPWMGGAAESLRQAWVDPVDSLCYIIDSPQLFGQAL